VTGFFCGRCFQLYEPNDANRPRGVARVVQRPAVARGGDAQLRFDARLDRRNVVDPLRRAQHPHRHQTVAGVDNQRRFRQAALRQQPQRVVFRRRKRVLRVRCGADVNIRSDHALVVGDLGAAGRAAIRFHKLGRALDVDVVVDVFLDVRNDFGALRETERLTNKATVGQFDADGRIGGGGVAVEHV
jgi:hypothetical protein